MYIDRIIIENFRNYTSLDIGLSNDVNVFYGNNGQGKTNLIEAIYYNTIGKSFRNTKDADIITNFDNKDHFKIITSVKNDITEEIYINYNKNKEKFIKVNGLYLRKLGQLMGNMLSVIFSPDDMNLIKEGPSVRRKFMDIAISQIRPTYYFDLIKYNKILFQKNNLLKSIKYGKISEYDDILSVWNAQLSEAGSSVISARYEFINIISETASRKNMNISFRSSKKEENLTLLYKTDVSCDIVDFKDKKSIENELLLLMNERKAKEIERETALYGPHRDDIEFRLNDCDLRKFGSQGQIRTAVLSVKLAELETAEKISGRKPVLLLDDVLSELDEDRRRAFVSNIGDVQAFISCTDMDSVHIKDRNIRFFNINSGHVV